MKVVRDLGPDVSSKSALFFSLILVQLLPMACVRAGFGTEKHPTHPDASMADSATSDGAIADGDLMEVLDAAIPLLTNLVPSQAS